MAFSILFVTEFLLNFIFCGLAIVSVFVILDIMIVLIHEIIEFIYFCDFQKVAEKSLITLFCFH